MDKKITAALALGIAALFLLGCTQQASTGTGAADMGAAVDSTLVSPGDLSDGGVIPGDAEAVSSDVGGSAIDPNQEVLVGEMI